MWPFNRSKKANGDQVVVPEEIKEYYAAEQRERAGVAWLLAVVTFLVVVAVVLGLFAGGRWLLNTSKNKGNTTATTKPQAEGKTTVSGDQPVTTAPSSPAPSTSTPSTPAPAPAASTNPSIINTGPTSDD